MVSFQSRAAADYVSVLAGRADKFALMIDAADVLDSVKASIRKLDQVVSYPRLLFLVNPAHSVELPPDVDEILNVKFSNEMLDPFIKEFGLLPLVSRTFPIATLEGATEFLMLKGNLNMLSRHLKFAPDWTYYPPNLVLNGTYHNVLVEFLPYLDADSETESWVLNSTEHTYIIERTWALMNLRNAEALVTASYIGVGTEYSSVLQYWKESLKDVDDNFAKGSVITYLG